MKVAGPGIGKEYKPAWLWLSSESSGKTMLTVSGAGFGPTHREEEEKKEGGGGDKGGFLLGS
jgi:hypothetical protein